MSERLKQNIYNYKNRIFSLITILSFVIFGVFIGPPGCSDQQFNFFAKRDVVSAATSTVVVAFLSSGTWNVPVGVTQVKVLVVAGGGGGGASGISAGGGGGAGGLIYNANYSVTPEDNISVTVGAAGVGGLRAGTQHGGKGGNSSFGSITALGGGGGRYSGSGEIADASGGSGGGGSGYTARYESGTGTPGQGYNGGAGYNSTSNVAGGGGGGAGAVGATGTASTGGNGGVGANYSSIFGTSYGVSGWFAGGGGGSGSVTQGTGQVGGGNGNNSGAGGAATANTGSGGGGATGNNNGGNGGSGIVLIAYETEGESISISSEENQVFQVGQSTTAISTITITDATPASITAANDIRIRIPDALSMTWDETDTNPTIGGNASSKIGGTEDIYLESPYDTIQYRHMVNLHGHTTQSDGAQSPTVYMETYRDLGYTAAIISDHDLVTADPNVSGIIHIMGTENTSGGGHMNSIDITTRYSGTRQQQINDAISQGGWASINHPVSGWTTTTIMALTGFSAMEIWNARYAYGQTYYDHALSNGRKIWLYASDDLHLTSEIYRGWIVVNSDKDQSTITKSELLQEIRDGNFYAMGRGNNNTNPPSSDQYPNLPYPAHFNEISVSGATVTVTTDKAVKFEFIVTGGTIAQTNNNTTTASYTASADDVYVRVKATYVDSGKSAYTWSNPLYVQEGLGGSVASYENNGKTLVLDVSEDFSAGDSITISGLSFKNFNATSGPDYLELIVDGSGGSVVAQDDKSKTVSSSAITVITPFLTSGTWEVPSGVTEVSVLVVGGGGGGGAGGSSAGGGGGAGGLRFEENYSVTPESSITVTVGTAGAGGLRAGVQHGGKGGTSTFGDITALGGGGGRYSGSGSVSDASGGSGGGGSGWNNTSTEPGIGTAGQGNDGGAGRNANTGVGGGGGGGASSTGVAASVATGGNGGNGVDYSAIFGTDYGASGWFAGGGGGAGSSTQGLGMAGGGNGSWTSAGGSATANTGSGGGGASGDNNGGNGGSGIVLIKYTYSSEEPPDPDPIFANVEIVQYATNTTEVGNQSCTTTFYNSPTSGNLIVSFLGVDKDSGTYTFPSGFSQIESHAGTSVSGAWAYKTSNGSETAINWRISNYQRLVCLSIEFSGLATSSVFDVSAKNNSGETIVTSISSGTTSPTNFDNEYVLAFFTADSQENADNNRTYSNNFSEIFYIPGVEFAAPVIVAAKTVSTTGVQQTTFSVTDTGDQMFGTIGTFKIAQVPAGIPTAPILYNNDNGVTQIAFDNIRQNTTTPTFRVSATNTSAITNFQIELNTTSSFTGTSYTQTFNGDFNSNVQYNLITNNLSPNLPTTNGVTYFVRVRASGNGGTTWGNWSSGLWSFTYTSSAIDPAWYQTVNAQFLTGILQDTVISNNSVILNTSGGIQATGGTITEENGYKRHVFSGNGTFQVTSGSGDVQVLVIGGGGGGGRGNTSAAGGGGAGGLVYRDNFSVSPSSISVTVGGGGAGRTGSSGVGSAGSNSVFGSLTALGGGGGSGAATAGTNGGSGGGGGAATSAYAPGSGSQPGSASGGFGNGGGTGFPSATQSQRAGGGGGGSNATGTNAAVNVAGNGGNGRYYGDIFGDVYGESGLFAGGGGGCCAQSGGTIGLGRAGGGNGSSTAAGRAATANTGSGGGAGCLNNNGGNGGSGIVIVRYPTMATEGTIMSPEINFSSFSNAISWSQAVWDEDETNGKVYMQVYYSDSSPCDSLIPNGALSGNALGFDSSPINLTGLSTSTYSNICLRATLQDDGGTPYLNDWAITIHPMETGSLFVDIVDDENISIINPFVMMNNVPFSYVFQTTTGTLGVANQKIRVTNETFSSNWTLAISASTTALWTSGLNSYDFNDPTTNAQDGDDADSKGGQLSINPSLGTITPQVSCSNTGLSLGSEASFNEGVVNSITLMSAGGSASTNCYWDLTGVDVSQTIPAEQPNSNDYYIDMVITVTAS